MGGVLDSISSSHKKHSETVKCKVFFIVDNETASLYAQLLTEIRNTKGWSLIETENVSSNDGELTKVVTYMVREEV